MIPLYDSIKSMTFPFVVIGIILINIYVFILEITAADPQEFINTYSFISSHFSFVSLESWKTVFFAMFMHGGWLHIISNMLFLWVFGDNIEDALGHFRFLLFYLLCGIAATLTQYFVDPNSSIPMLGASGAIAGVLGAYWSLYPRAKVKTLVPIGIFLTSFDLPASLMIGFWFLTQLLNGYAAVAQTKVTGDIGGVAFWAHIGGFIAGILLVKLFPPAKRSFFRVE